MTELTAMEIADKLDFLTRSVMGIRNIPTLTKLCDCGEKAADMLRQQHAEIERLTALNSALTAKGNAFVIENARQAEKIDSLTKERDAVIARASALTHHLTQVIGEHYAPSDCYSSGPLLGDARDVVCPACEALRFLNNPREVGLMKKGI